MDSIPAVLLDTSVVHATPTPENDIWIAALALEYQLPLAARDAHFDLVIGLSVLKW